jgi:chromosome segregation ATPase
VIEQGIYFALGCIVTALLALMFAPVFWARALRLTRQRLQLQIPISMQEILAERDQLRAAFAVERLRLEQEMERVRQSKGADMAELGRRAKEIAALKEQAAVLETTMQRLAELEAENGSLHVGLHDAEAAVELWRQRAELTQSHKERLEDEVASQRTTIASLNTRCMGLEMRLSDAERAFAQREKATEAGLRTRLETAVSHATRHETANLTLVRELDDARVRIRQLEKELEAAVAGTVATAEASPSDDAGLRESIHALGLAVARLSRDQRDGRAASLRKSMEDQATA